MAGMGVMLSVDDCPPGEPEWSELCAVGSHPVRGIYILIFVILVGQTLVWHFRKKDPGAEHLGGYWVAGIYNAPYFALLFFAMMSFLSFGCFFFGLSHAQSNQSVVLGAVHVLLTATTVVFTCRWHYGSWDFRKNENWEWTTSNIWWCVASALGAIGIFATGMMCLY